MYTLEREEFCFESTNELVHFLKDEWSYEQKDVDALLEDRYEDDFYQGKQDSVRTVISLTSENSGGYTRWFLSMDRETREF